jgi:hypothetical protein
MIQCRWGSIRNATVARVARGELRGSPVEGVFLVSRLQPLLPDGRGSWGLMAACRVRLPGEPQPRTEVWLERCEAEIEEDYSGAIVAEIRLGELARGQS